MARRFLLTAAFSSALSLGAAAAACAQDGALEVALVVDGPDAASAREAFRSFVPVPESRSWMASPETLPEGTEALVRIDTATPTVRVWRRTDGVVFERRFEGPQDAYALAVVASELLEVARTGADPASVGATVVEAQVDDRAEPEPEPRPGPEPDTSDAWALALTPGIGVEGWLSTEGAEPWIVQPTLFVELLTGPARETWRLGGALFVSALGAWSADRDGFETRYARHDFGLRLSVGGDLGPVRTRLLAHLRGGASLVVGGASREGVNDDEVEALLAGAFVGLGLDARQPLIEGLELFLDVSVDLLPAPIRFTGLGATLVQESDVRVGARLGLAWRFR